MDLRWPVIRAGEPVVESVGGAAAQRPAWPSRVAGADHHVEAGRPNAGREAIRMSLRIVLAVAHP